MYICRKQAAREEEPSQAPRQLLPAPLGHGVSQLGLEPEKLMNNGFEQRDEVLFDMIYVTLVGHFELQRHSVEIERNDRLEPLGELLVRGMLANAAQTALPHISICLVIDYHEFLTVSQDKIVNKITKKTSPRGCLFGKYLYRRIRVPNRSDFNLLI